MSASNGKWQNHRKARMGFPYSGEYDRLKKQWFKLESGKAIGTPCESYLFHPTLHDTKWSDESDVSRLFMRRIDEFIAPGLYDILISNWQLESEVEGTGRIDNLPEYFTKDSFKLGPYCSDCSTFEWNINDATHTI